MKSGICRNSSGTILLILLLFPVLAGAAGEEWNRTYEGIYLQDVNETSDGGFILAGSKDSDFMLIKTDRQGNEEWKKKYPNTEKTVYEEYIFSKIHFVRQMSDKGYVLSGRFFIGDSRQDYWIIKTDPEGNESWRRKVHDENNFHETSDGGFIISEWSGIKYTDIYLIKTDSEGREQWKKNIYRRQNETRIEAVLQTSDGGYIAAGKRYICCDSWDKELFLVKTDRDGNKQWDSIFQEYNRIKTLFIVQGQDGGYILGGRNMFDLWLGKFSNDGKSEWNRTYTGDSFDRFLPVSDGFMIYRKASVIRVDLEGNIQGINIFNESGSMPVLMTDDGGSLFFKSENLIKQGRSVPIPVVSFNPKYPGANQIITFDVSWSYNNSDNITYYNWDFGDGTEIRTDSKIMTHSYPLEGYYTVNLTIINENLPITSRNFSVIIQKTIPPPLIWQRTFGGSGDDYGKSAVQTDDNGYMIAGDIRIPEGIGVMMVKTDQEGNEQWNKTFGGPDAQRGINSIRQISGGGYIFSGSKRQFNGSGQSYWLVRTDHDGNMVWEKTFGTTGYNDAYSVQETRDWGYIVAGIKDLAGGEGIFGIWVVKTDSEGNEQWNKTYGEEGSNEVRSIQQTSDGGYIMAGSSYMSSTTSSWLLKIDPEGNKHWFKTFEEAGQSFITESAGVTSDGGYVIAGKRWHVLQDTIQYEEKSEGWIAKTDMGGKIMWQKTFDLSKNDRARSVNETSDGGYIVLLETNPNINGMEDVNFVLIKIDTRGNIEWQTTFGTVYEMPSSVSQIKDSGYILSGATDSNGPQGSDFLLMKVGTPGGSSNEPVDNDSSATAGSGQNQGSYRNTGGFGLFLALLCIIAVYYIRMKI